MKESNTKSRLLFFSPVLFIVLSNVLYDISANEFPDEINAQAGMAFYYLVAAVISIILFFLTSKNKNFFKELKKVNKATFSLALGCTGLDFGYVLAFRAGWEISFASLVCNILIAVSLIFVGVLFYREVINKKHVAGILLCLTGFVLITHGSF
jgi:drug/metabolite transporter (DMT)-like permease